MLKLQETYKKNNTSYTLVKRNDKAAMYKQFLPDGLHIGYEVFIIKVQPEFRFPNGVVNPTKEKFPGNNDFGKIAWSFKTIKCAEERYSEITNGILRPEKPKVVKEDKPKGKKRKRGRPRKYPKNKKLTVKKAKRKFVFEGKEYPSKSFLAKIWLKEGLSKNTIASKLGIKVQTVHAVAVKMKGK